MNVTLRDYQRAMVEQVSQCWAAGTRRVLGVLPTGGGKTEVAIHLIEESIKAGRALIVVERKTLCEQWVWRLRRAGVAGYIGVLQGDNTRAVDAPILVATAQTIRARGVPERLALGVIDESHIWHKTHDDVLHALGDAPVLGLTATPLRAGLGLRFDSVVIGARIRELQALAFLVKARYFAPKPDAVERALQSVAIRAGDFVSSELSEAMRNRAIIGDVVSEWQKRGEDRQTIAFCVDKQHARDLAAEFVAAGVEAEVVLDDTDDDDRSRIFEAFDKRTMRVLCSVGVLGVGFDSPVAACAIMARPTLSYSLYLQQGGRVLRPCAGKDSALILDHAGNTTRFGLLEEFEPPTKLSQIDKDTDRRSRRDFSGVWACLQCEALNPKNATICEECGTPRRRNSTVVVLDGELRNVWHADHEPLPGPTHERLREVYQMFMHFALSKERSIGWAWRLAQKRFRLTDEQAKKLMPWRWREMPPIPPDEETARWLAADYRRSKAIENWRERQSMDTTV